jgi:hypothetical protein
VHIDHWKERRMMAADTVTVQTYNAEGVLQATLRADHAELDEAEDILTARHHVVIVNSQGDSLLTEYVVWNRATDIIESDQPITVIRQDGVFRGNGVRTNIEFFGHREQRHQRRGHHARLAGEEPVRRLLWLLLVLAACSLASQEVRVVSHCECRLAARGCGSPTTNM